MIETNLKKLAKSSKFQNLFSAVKEISTLKLFRNTEELSKIQQIFLSYLYFYHDLSTDVMLKKIDKEILDDDIYCDAYMKWKREKDSKKPKDKKRGNKKKDVHLVFDNKSSRRKH